MKKVAILITIVFIFTLIVPKLIAQDNAFAQDNLFNKDIVLDPKYLDDMAQSNLSKGEYENAISFALQSIETKKTLWGENDVSLITSYEILGNTYTYQKQFDKALEWYQKAYNISKANYGEGDSLSCLLLKNLATTYSLQGNNEKALELLKQIQPLLEKDFNKNAKTLALVYDGIAFILNTQNNFEEAIEYETKAINAIKEVKEPENFYIANFYNNLGYILYLNKNYEDAIENLNKAITLKESFLKSGDISFAQTYTQLGFAYRELEEYDKSLDFLNKAINIKQNCYGENSPELIFDYNNLTGILIKLHKFNEALEEYNHILSIKQSNNIESYDTNLDICSLLIIRNDFDEAKKLVNTIIKNLETDSNTNANILFNASLLKAIICFRDGDIESVLNIFLELSKNKNLSLENKINVYLTLGSCYTNLNKHKEGYEYLNNALLLCENNNITNAYVLSNLYSFIAYNSYINKLKNPLELINKSIILYEETGTKPVFPYIFLSYYYMDSKEYNKAYEICLKLEPIVNNNPEITDIVRIPLYIRLYQLSEKLGLETESKKWEEKLNTICKNPQLSTDIRTATFYIIKAIINFDKNNLDIALESINKAHNILKETDLDILKLQQQALLGDIYFNKKDYEQAFSNYKEVINYSNKISVDTAMEKDIFTITKNLNSYLNNLIFCCLLLKKYDELFNCVETSKAKALTKSIANKKAMYDSGIKKEDLNQLIQLENDYNQCLKLYKDFVSDDPKLSMMKQFMPEDETSKKSMLQKLQENKLTKLEELNNYKNLLSEKYPKYYKLRYPDSITFEELSIILNDKKYEDTAIVEYFINNDTINIIIITNKKLNGTSIKIKPSELKKLLNDFIKPLKIVSYASNTQEYFETLDQFDVKSAYTLYELLIKPVEPLLMDSATNKTIYKNIIIIPHKKLFYLPFESIWLQKKIFI